MTSNKSINQIFDALERNFLGLPNLNAVNFGNSGYPFYNVLQKLNDDGTTAGYLIEIAVAGFSEDEISISQVKDSLVISGTKPESDPKDQYFENTYTPVFQGISRKNFKREFTLTPDIKVNGARLRDGILTIGLDKIIPEEDKPRLIKIN